MDQLPRPTVLQTRTDAAWKAARSKLLITASRVACFLVEHPYTSPRREYEIATGTAQRDEQIDPDLADIGLDAESVLLSRLQRLRPGSPLRKNRDLFLHPTLPFGGTPDFISRSRERNVTRCWQGKALHPGAYRRHWSDGPPTYILLQHQAEYLLTGAREGGVVALVRDADWTTIPYDIEPHEGVMRSIEAAIEEFAEAVRKRIPPQITYASDAAWVKERQRVTPKIIRDMTGSNAWADACARWLAARDEEDAAKKRREAALAECIDLAEDAQIAHGHGFVLKRTEVAASPGKTITTDMVGTVIGARKGHVRTEMSEEAAPATEAVPSPKKKVHKA